MKTTDNLFGFFKDKKALLLILSALIGLILLLVGGGFARSSENHGDAALQDYLTSTEKRLQSTVCAIDGVRDARVFITVENTFETVYATNATLNETGADNRSTQKQLAYTSTRSYGEQPVVVKQLLPRISGVLVVCGGGNNAVVRDEVIRAVSVALNISQSKIYVTGGTDPMG